MTAPITTTSAAEPTTGPGAHQCIAGPAVESVTPWPPAALRDWVYENPRLSAERRALFARWLEDPTPREDIAASLGLSLGELLRTFNDTAPLSPAMPFTYRGIPFTSVAMDGTCDDIADGRFPLFGTPVTFRCYLDDPTLLPQEMFEAADWNFMDAGRPGFLGYAYGVHHEGAVYLAGVQSDLAVRYAYLFQGRDDRTEIRRGDEVVEESSAALTERFADHVPVLRRTFQRYWIPILLSAVVAWTRQRTDITELGLLQFPLTRTRTGRAPSCTGCTGNCHSGGTARCAASASTGPATPTPWPGWTPCAATSASA